MLKIRKLFQDIHVDVPYLDRGVEGLVAQVETLLHLYQ